MATSSIFANFDIKDKKTAEDFVEAIDKSFNSTFDNDEKVLQVLSDSHKIKMLWEKRKR